jgi:hypothetical protein
LIINNFLKRKEKMAQKGKSIVDEALLEAEQIDKAFEANAKEILSQTMGSEIEEMVKESLEGSNGLNEDDDVELEVSDDIDIDADDDGEIELDLELGDDSDDEDNEDLDMDLDLDVDDEADLDMDDEVETIDLTGADDMDVITVFKKMGPEDEIEVVQDGDSVEFKDNETGAEYRVELNGAGADVDMDMDLDVDADLEDMDMDMGDMDMEMDDEDMDMDLDLDMDMDMDDEEDDMDDMMDEEVVYEIEISEEEDEDDEMMEGEYMDEDMDETDEDEMDEASRTLGAGKKWGRKGLDKPKAAPRHLKQESVRRDSKLIKENKVLKHNFNKVVSENEELKGEYNKLVDALKQFRTKLNEVAVFNSNLTYAVRLFTENTTTKEEKVDIIKRFDEAKSLKESKMIYNNLKKEVSNKAPIKESIDNKVNETKGSGSKTQISESKVYVHPELEKMKKLWDFNYKY